MEKRSRYSQFRNRWYQGGGGRRNGEMRGCALPAPRSVAFGCTSRCFADVVDTLELQHLLKEPRRANPSPANLHLKSL